MKQNVTMEQISGPWDGIYIAAYTAELDGRFYGYVKLSVSKPSDVWTAQVMMKLTARASYREESEALEAVEKRALRVIANLRAAVGNAETRAAVEGGATVIQLRVKDASTRKVVEVGR